MFGYFMLLHTQLVPRVLFTVFPRFNELKTELKTIKNKNSLQQIYYCKCTWDKAFSMLFCEFPKTEK